MLSAEGDVLKEAFGSLLGDGIFTSDGIVLVQFGSLRSLTRWSC